MLKRGLRLSLLLLLLSLPWLPCPAQAVGRALLVGCDRFVSQQETTPSAAMGVSEVAAALSEGIEEVLTCPDGLSGVDALADLILEAFDGAEEGDVSCFYLCTHGIWSPYDPAEGMTLLLSDGENEEGVTAAGLKEIFDQIRGTKVLILDACRSGAMIGKGVYGPFENLFAGDSYKVICSSGGQEDSWFWRGLTADGSQVTGEGYFSGALTLALGAPGGHAADADRDGAVTMSELKRYLRANHGASTVQFYPEEDDFPLLTYDTEAENPGPALRQLAFETGAVTPGSEISFSFTVTQRVRVAYQLVYEQNGRWDFASAPLIWDDEANLSAFGAAPGWLEPGFRARQLVISPAAGEGYVLLQVLTSQGGALAVAGSAVVCVQPASGDPELAVVPSGEAFCPAEGEELNLIVQHSVPCEITLTVEDEEGQMVCRLLSAEPTRPEHLWPEGTTVAWTGQNAEGGQAPAGRYRLRARVRLGGVTYEAFSDWILLRDPGETAGNPAADGE
ncbi:MAG: CHAT domain-containing protein [Clostridia bacterium]|nr:CHAT domain-containing protein [Clostridia bacterium]